MPRFENIERVQSYDSPVKLRRSNFSGKRFRRVRESARGSEEGITGARENAKGWTRETDTFDRTFWKNRETKGKGIGLAILRGKRWRANVRDWWADLLIEKDGMAREMAIKRTIVPVLRPSHSCVSMSITVGRPRIFRQLIRPMPNGVRVPRLNDMSDVRSDLIYSGLAVAFGRTSSSTVEKSRLSIYRLQALTKYILTSGFLQQNIYQSFIYYWFYKIEKIKPCLFL